MSVKHIQVFEDDIVYLKCGDYGGEEDIYSIHRITIDKNAIKGNDLDVFLEETTGYPEGYGEEKGEQNG